MSVLTRRSARLASWVMAPVVVAAVAVAGGSGAALAQGYNCMTNQQYGVCPYSPYTVNQDEWNPGQGSEQILSASSAASWQIQTYQPSGVPVRSYPNVSQDFGKPISSFTQATATFSDTTPPGAAANAAFDVWVDGTPTQSPSTEIEVMLWTDNQGNRPAGSKIATVTLSGQSYKVFECKKGKCFKYPYYAFVVAHNESSGQAPLLAELQWLTRKGLVPASDPLEEIDYGWEIRDTDNQALYFTMNNYNLQTAFKG